MKVSDDELRVAAKQIGKRISRLRKERGRTQAQLEEDTGIYDVGAIERGEANPTLLTLIRLASGLEVDLADLMKLREEVSEREILASLKRLVKGKSPELQRKILDLARLLVS